MLSTNSKSNVSQNHVKGQKYLKEAENKLNSVQGFIGSLIGSSSKTEEAIDLYIKAANHFKMDHNWKMAGNAFTSAAKLHKRSGNKHETALNYISAANCYKKCDAEQAINYLTKAINYYTDLGRLSTSAKHHITIAEIYESEMCDIEKAVNHYETAAQYMKADESNASANKCLLIVANYCALKENYEKAIAIYEEIGKFCIESPLLKYSANNHFFRAALCHTCVDILNGELAVKRYEDMFPAFSDSRECKLIKTLINKLEEGDSDGFTDAVKSYDTVSRFDKWFIEILLKIKKHFDSELDMK